MTPPRKFSALPPRISAEASPKAISRRTSYQLSPGSIGISPLSTPHPHPFQRMWVRSSIAFYGSFNLDMDRSPGFGSAHTDSGPIKTWFPYGSAPLVLNLACMRNSPDRSTKSTSTACKHRVSGSLSLPSRGPFHLSFTVLCAIGHQGVFSLTGWSPLLQSRFHVSRPTLDPAVSAQVSCTGLSPSPAGFPKTIPLPLQNHVRGPNPSMHARKSSFLSPPPAT